MRTFELSVHESRKLVINELVEAAQTGQLTVWVGAGISYSPPASLPLAFQIVRSVCQAIASALSIPLDVLLTHQGEIMRLEPFLRLIEDVCSFQDIENFLDVLRLGKPNQNHLALANLLTTYSGCTVISLNFDYLIEEALLNSFGIISRVVVPSNQEEDLIFSVVGKNEMNNVENREQVGRIIKPHGTLVRENGTRGIIATVQSLGLGLPQPLQQRLREAINDRVLMVIGYSDDDLDLFPLLQSTHPHAVYWNTLSWEISTKVNEWLLLLDERILTTRLINKCEYLFSFFPDEENMVLPSSVALDLDKHAEEWVKGINSVSRIAAIAAWLAQDRLRVDYAKSLYLLALEQEECKRDSSLNRIIRYRYAELLRHQMEDKRNALKQYALVLWLAINKYPDLPLVIVTIRSLASSLRSISHRSGRLITLIYSTVAIIMLLSAWTLTKITTVYQWDSSKFARDKGGTWLFWEFGMVILGFAQKIWWPKRMRRFLLYKALTMFETSEKSIDIYEKSAAIFGQARTIGMIAHIDHNPRMVGKAYSLLDKAKELFVLLDDVTGLNNFDQLLKALENNGPDPWLGSQKIKTDNK